MKKPTVKQSIIIEKKLKLRHEEWLIQRWNAIKGGKIEVRLVNRENGEKIDRVIDNI